ncbi:nickel pincer cofactor biosynthesis protein LarC [Microbacterium sp. K24]|uniref:nickel pincer cofactor biosynthesis protein LarC n=1 Tax=Microbacterium sp. K24 TaxID=2305446 RepID=UPI00197BDBFA|nr:nickel pincer cofactor biosynthesis protein LarC [Microbacterium sp. K24]
MILWLNPASGISGDMLLGALLDLGAPLDEVEAAVHQTGVEGWSINPRHVSKDGIGATYAGVQIHDNATSRHAWELYEAASRVADPLIVNLARKTIYAIATVEARIHGTTPDDVHLHEVGGVDTIVDIVGVGAALRALGVDRVYSHPVVLGTGRVKTEHGLLPLPAPATAALLEGARVRGAAALGETVTPTGAALLKAMGTDYSPLETTEILRVGYGAGTKDFLGQPNVLQAILCAPGTAADLLTTRKTLLETNLDDVTGEHVGYLISAALNHGALDAWADQVIGKKGRPAFVLHVLCDVTTRHALQALLFAESGTLGIRVASVDRVEVPRWTTSVHVAGAEVPVKMSPFGAKPERDVVVEVAAATGLTTREIAARASAAVLDLPEAREDATTPHVVSSLWAPGPSDEVLTEQRFIRGHSHPNAHDHDHGHSHEHSHEHSPGHSEQHEHTGHAHAHDTPHHHDVDDATNRIP